ncbi:acyl-CoA thioesterase [Persicobacter psychrovividus]|uniref:4-hydroxybenzoyl-CoA thioesterase n=1 Tax=Persicobacter psychrovividus TaxID=387638 RepID=A0ABM7VM90_9BACT|nr:4-hydroxybenzoyl-CoA thioesterase [Persicobacter psychrovividus]
MAKRKTKIYPTTLVSVCRVPVRFSEVDSMRVVWHGNYVKYFEDGREAFGNEFELSYMDYFHNELLTPIVKLDCNYKQSLRYGDIAEITTRYMACDAAKIYFEYMIKNAETGDVAATGSSCQVFINTDQQLQLTSPPFYEKWKAKWLSK